MTRKTLLLTLVAGCLIVTLGWLQETKADDIQSLLANPTPEVTGTVGDLHNQLLARGPFRRLRESREERERNEYRSPVSVPGLAQSPRGGSATARDDRNSSRQSNGERRMPINRHSQW